MSHCANYLLREGGVVRTANSRWGSKALPRDLFWGPDVGVPFLRELCSSGDPDETFVYSELMTEGAALADVDARRLLLFGGEDLRWVKPLQHAFLSMIRIAWDGWRVDWAFGGWPQIAAEAGVETSLDDAPTEVAATVRPWTADSHRRLFVVSIGERDHAVATSIEQLLGIGPRLIELVRDQPTIPLTPAINRADGGVHLELERRSHTYWIGDSEPSWLPARVRATSPGWQVSRQDGGMPGQLVVAGRDPTAIDYDLPALRAQLLESELGERDVAGIAELVADLRVRAAQPGVVAAPGALTVPATPELTPEQKRQRLAEVLARLDGS